MTCAEVRPLLDAYFDTELDLTGSLGVERHVSECSQCAGTLKDLERLRDELTPDVFNLAAGADLQPLKRSIRTQLPSRAIQRSAWRSPAVYSAIAAALVLAIVVPMRLRRSGAEPAREIVDAHVRSLMADHLVDVPSSDQHTVKPWFQGKIDFAPDVPDLTAQGFELIGGRLDVMGGRPAAAIVYKRRGHFVNWWISRGETGAGSPLYTSVDGYQVVHWGGAGLEDWVVSDLNRQELQSFVDLIRNR